MIELLVGLALFLGVVVLIPLLILRLLLGLALTLVFLPFKLLGALFRVGFGLIGLVFKLLFSGLGLVLALSALLGGLILLPLLPLLVLGFGIWLILRLFRSPAPARFAA